MSILERPFQRLYPPTPIPEGPALWLIFQGESLVIPEADPPVLLEGTAQGPPGLAVTESLLLGMLGERACLVGAIPPDTAPPASMRMLGLRSLLSQAEAEVGILAGYAAQMLRWSRMSRFCAACAHPLDSLEGTWGRICPACSATYYPPVSPAVLVLVYDNERILLASQPGWGKRYSLVAGFVEPGETLEQCAAREVHEEVGVDVDSIHYLASQPWPFPHQLMVGFSARYVAGEITIDSRELADAAWFTRDALPELPAPISLSRHLIERWRVGQL